MSNKLDRCDELGKVTGGGGKKILSEGLGEVTPLGPRNISS